MLSRNADGGRTPHTGRVDFTMMYVPHDAFTRDLQRLTAAAGPCQTAEPVVRTGWAMPNKQLHIHHATEDTSLWPTLRQKATRPRQESLDQPQRLVLFVLHVVAQFDPATARPSRAAS